VLGDVGKCLSPQGWADDDRAVCGNSHVAAFE
jgi:hypothetical protein